MKTLLSAPELLTHLKEVLAARYSTGVRLKPSPQVQHAEWGPLGGALNLLLTARDYATVKLAIYLDDDRAIVLSVGDSSGELTEFLVPITIAGRRLGELRVASGREMVAAPDRVLLKRVAAELALFLTGEGKYIVTRARQHAARETKVAAAATPVRR
ncbi:MAG: hypothetical protein ACE14L_02680 [Terriglobales bacterium]